MTRETRELVLMFGKRLRNDVAVAEKLPFPIALMLEHLRRAEQEARYESGRQDDI